MDELSLQTPPSGYRQPAACLNKEKERGRETETKFSETSCCTELKGEHGIMVDLLSDPCSSCRRFMGDCRVIMMGVLNNNNNHNNQ